MPAFSAARAARPWSAARIAAASSIVVLPGTNPGRADEVTKMFW
jgi:hypothetical protein